MRITIAGTGYVGLSNAVLLAQHNQAVAIDIVAEKVAMLNRKQSPIEDAEIEDSLQNKPLNLRATARFGWTRRVLGKPEHVLYDLKYLLPASASDLRL
jgi:UDP-glucose 6-dehydrogenase